MKRACIRFAITVIVIVSAIPARGGKPETDPQPEVRNIILMVGDGMGLAQVSALMLTGNYAPVNMERATTGGFVKTFSADNRVTDSAASATAYSTGEKTNNGYLGVGPDSCPLETILEKAECKGLATGLVATTHVMHATPGAFYAHTPNRDDYEGIALGLLVADIDVVIGGGRKYLTLRADGRNLVAELEAKHYFVGESLEDLDGVFAGHVMAIYPGAGLPLAMDGRPATYLADATSKALEILTTNSDGSGFFVMIEGSYIDSAGHDNNAEMLMGEMRDFDTAVGVAFDYADTHPETLVVVLADHETGGLTIPSGDSNFRLADQGIDFDWATRGHTGTMTPVFAYGAEAHRFGGIMDNTEVNHRMEQLLGLE